MIISLLGAIALTRIFGHTGKVRWGKSPNLRPTWKDSIPSCFEQQQILGRRVSRNQAERYQSVTHHHSLPIFLRQ
ncbi:hypothetical protein BDV19DRAFT_357954 [Aspergillus venezuelensis]